MGLKDFIVNKQKENAELRMLPSFNCNNEKVINLLTKAYERKNNIKVEYNGKMLYSCDAKTEDDVYKQMYDMTKSEYLKALDKYINISDNVIVKPFESDWKLYVEDNFDKGNIKKVEFVSQILKELKEQNSIENAIELFKSRQYTNIEAQEIRNIVFSCSMNGSLFYKGTDFNKSEHNKKREIQEKEIIEKIIKKTLLNTYDSNEAKLEFLRLAKLITVSENETVKFPFVLDKLYVDKLINSINSSFDVKKSYLYKNI